MQPEEAANVERESVAAAGPGDAASAALVIPEDGLVIVPVRNMVLFPGMIVPISVGRDSSIAAAQQAVKTERPVGIVLQRNAEADTPGPGDLCQVGTIAHILRYITTPDGGHHMICRGAQRFRVVEVLEGYPFLVARVTPIEEPDATGKEIEARFLQLRERAIEALGLLPEAPQELVANVKTIASPGALADLVAGFMDAKSAEKQAVLEAVDLNARLDAVLGMLAHRIEVLKLSREIEERTKASMDER
jgi:ATP-dependent Lon protease